MQRVYELLRSWWMEKAERKVSEKVEENCKVSGKTS
jgi:hypothetical protein